MQNAIKGTFYLANSKMTSNEASNFIKASDIWNVTFSNLNFEHDLFFKSKVNKTAGVHISNIENLYIT